MRKRFTRNRLFGLVAILILTVGLAGTQLQADAGPSTSGTMYRIEGISDGSVVYHAPLVELANHVMPGTTPVNSPMVCVPGEASLYRIEFTLGAAPTFAAAAQVTNVLQQSFDRGATWSNVASSFAAVNATLTPAGGQESITLGDVRNSTTAIARADCYRVRTTWAGAAGTTTVNYGVQIYAK